MDNATLKAIKALLKSVLVLGIDPENEALNLVEYYIQKAGINLENQLTENEQDFCLKADAKGIAQTYLNLINRLLTK